MERRGEESKTFRLGFSTGYRDRWGSRVRTRLWNEIPDRQGKYREFSQELMLPAKLTLSFPNIFGGEGVATDSLRSRTGN
jgi:hypothetical protein